MQVTQWLKSAEARLKAAGIETSARLDAQLIAASVLGKDRALLIADTTTLDITQQEQLETLLVSREERTPVAYILGSREFYGLDFRVSNSVLVPRPETEAMVEYLIDHAPQNATLLEIGTGSGAIAIATAYHRHDIAITATEISAAALKIAQINQKSNNTNVSLIESDMFASVPHQSFDIIAANLPYVPTGARRQIEITYEPDIALYSGEDGLEHYERFFKELAPLTHTNTWIIIEASITQFSSLTKLAAVAGYQLSTLSEYIFIAKPERRTSSD